MDKKTKENVPLKKEAAHEVLEISSTGYGLESVAEPLKESENSNPSCGGL